eukprot:scaffold328_cov248-Pinguiococcus_pyrenoidosus.AAC.8
MVIATSQQTRVSRGVTPRYNPEMPASGLVEEREEEEEKKTITSGRLHGTKRSKGSLPSSRRIWYMQSIAPEYL